jgi:4-azaleucine resistance transporter AzlC
VLAGSAGFDGTAAVVMSATTFAGSAQFAAASVLDTGGEIAAAVAAAVLLNARYAPIGVTVASLFSGPRLRRLVEAQLIVDESWALSRGPDGLFDRRLLIGAGLIFYVGWVGGTAIGALVGDALGEPETYGLDAAFPALFLALLVPQVRTRRALAAALGGGAIALVLIPFVPAGVPIIAAVAACLVGWRGK